MYILLSEGDVIREGDEVYCRRSDTQTYGAVTGWVPVELYGSVIGPGNLNPFRRNLTGWEAVKYALETEVLGNDKEGCETTDLFWGCGKCETGALRQDRYWQCPGCGEFNTEDIPARKAEVILKIMEE